MQTAIRTLRVRDRAITGIRAVRAVPVVLRGITAITYKGSQKKIGATVEKPSPHGFKKHKIADTHTMEKLRKVYQFFKGKYELLTLKKYTTIAGTLVFFLIMSIVPLTFWLTLLVGKLPIDFEQILQLSVFASVQQVLLYVQKEAVNATASTSVILLVTTLYSATNLFYQMRRSGELIYDYHRPKKGFRLRLGALALMFIVMAIVVAFGLLFALGTYIFSRLITGVWERFADYTLLLALSFALVLLLNAYICPHKMPLKCFLKGTALTVSLWAVTVVGFAFYLRISNMNKLYGALSTIIVFLLWLYILMICFIIGVIMNSEKILSTRKERAKQRKKQRLAHKKAPTAAN